MLVKDQIVGGDEGRAAAVEDGCPAAVRSTSIPPPLRLRDSEIIGDQGSAPDATRRA